MTKQATNKPKLSKRARRQRLMIYIMILIMLLSTITAGIASIF